MFCSRQLNGCKVLWRKPKHGGDIDCGKPADRPVKDRTLMRGEIGVKCCVRGLVEHRGAGVWSATVACFAVLLLGAERGGCKPWRELDSEGCVEAGAAAVVP